MPNSPILFDFNGVIVNDEPQHCAALITTLAEYDLALDEPTYYAEYLGFDDRACFRYAFGQAGRAFDDALVAEAIERKAVHYERSIRASMRLIPGAEAFVRACAAAGHPMAVVSGALRREIDLVLGTAGLRQFFPVVVAAEDVDACKPDPQGYRKACDALGVDPAQGVAIEDSIPGAEAAREAGLRVQMLATSHPAEELDVGDAIWTDLTGRHPHELPFAHARG